MQMNITTVYIRLHLDSEILLFVLRMVSDKAILFFPLQLLYSLKALDDNGKLTVPLGVQLAEFPVDPMLGKIVSCCNRLFK